MNRIAVPCSATTSFQLTGALALKWAKSGVRLNALAPGCLETDLKGAFFATAEGAALVKRIPMRRLGRLHELSGLLLASNAGSFMTGSVLVVDGGHTVNSL